MTVRRTYHLDALANHALALKSDAPSSHIHLWVRCTYGSHALTSEMHLQDRRICIISQFNL